MKKLFAPGCALMLYKPYLADRLLSLLKDNVGNVDCLSTCCKHEPIHSTDIEVINICPGCNKRFNNDYSGVTTVSLWEILAETDLFPFPDYNEKAMSIIDACPTRDQEKIHDSIRILLKKMNIRLIEPVKTKTHGTCCGDTFYGTLPVNEVKQMMIKRTLEMPAEDVAVYCISCTKSVFIGGKQPRYLIDLLFNENTVPKTLDPDAWHKELDDYILKH